MIMTRNLDGRIVMPFLVMGVAMSGASASAGDPAQDISLQPILRLTFDELPEDDLTDKTIIGTGSASARAALATFGEGGLERVMGPGGEGDHALKFVDANPPGGTRDQGGQLTVPVPAVTGDYTLAFFIKPDGLQAGWDIVLEAPGPLGRIHFGRAPTDAGTTTLQVKLGDRPATVDLPAGHWSHLALTYDDDAGHNGLGLAQLYLDGQRVEYRNNQYIGTDKDDLAGPEGGELVIGAGANHHRPFHGSMDDLVIFDQALTAEQVQQLATPTNPARKPAEPE